MSRPLICFLLFISFSNAASSFSFLPKLELVNVIKGNPKQLNNQYQMGFDDRGQLCIAANQNGMFCYDGSQLEKLNDYGVGLLTLNTDGRQQLFFSDGFRLFQLVDGYSRILLHPNNFDFQKGEYIEALFPFHDDTNETKFIILTSQSIYLYSNAAVKKIVSLMAGDVAYFVRNDPVTGNIEVGTHNGLKVYDDEGEEVRESFRGLKVSHLVDDYTLTNKGLFYRNELLAEGNFFSAFKLAPGNLIAATNKGLCTVNLDKVVCPESSDDIVRSILIDKFNNIWAITNNGLKQAAYSHFEHIDTRYGLSNNQVRAIEQSSHILYIGTLKGINTYNTITKQLGALDNTLDLQVRSLLVADNKLFIASLNKGLLALSLETNTLRTIDKSITGRIVSLAKYNDQVWAATKNNGINTYTFRGELIDRGLQPNIKQIRKLIVCNDSMYIVSINKGLVRLDKNKELLSEGDKSAYVAACNEDQIAAANDSHVYVMAADQRIIESEKVTSPIANLFYYSNTLWQLQENGLKKFAASKPIFSDNYLPYLYQGISLVHGRYLYAGSTKGLIAINLDDYKNSRNDTPSPRLIVNSFKSNGALVLKPRSDNHALTKRIGIYYQTEGYSARKLHWGQELVFPLVSHNHNYGDQKLTFFLSYDGKNKIDSKTVTWQVSPPFWLTWWAYCFYIAIIGLISSTILWFRLQANKKVSIANQTLAASAQEHCEELLELNTQLTRASQSKSEFIAKVSHELRSPLTGIQGMYEILKDTQLSQFQKSYVDAGLQCSYTLSTMVDDILEVSKIEFDKVKINRLAFELEPLFRSSLLPLAHKAKQRNVFFKLDIVMPESLESMACISDPVKLQQIVVNLANNAIKFTPEGSIMVKLEIIQDDLDKQKGKLAIMVKDTGIGIPYDKREVIFEQFEQVDNTTARHHEGAGLGLAIIRSFVDKLGGELRLQSTEGKGSCFDLIIPMAFKEKHHVLASEWYARDISETDLAAYNSKKYNLLLVDDNYYNRQVGKLFLEFAAIDVTVADSGETAIDYFEQQRYDIVFLDLHMPDIDGFEAADAMRDIEDYRQHSEHTPIIALTADKTDEAREKCLQAGIDDILIKPYSKRQLLAKLQTWIETKDLLSQLPNQKPPV